MYNIHFAAPFLCSPGWRSEMFTNIFIYLIEGDQNVGPIYNTSDLIIH
jgi:hypothetical protein